MHQESQPIDDNEVSPFEINLALACANERNIIDMKDKLAEEFFSLSLHELRQRVAVIMCAEHRGEHTLHNFIKV